MVPIEDSLRAACQKIREFQVRYGIAWTEFPKLEALDPKFSGLDPRRWADGVKGVTKPYGNKRQLTLDLADLIDQSPEMILAKIHYRNRESGKAVLSLCGAATREIQDSEALSSQMIVLAGNGLHEIAIDGLVAACQRDLSHHPDEAMAPLRTLIYLSSRYLQPQGFVRKIEKLLPALCNRRVQRVDPALRGQVIAQIGSYFLDKGYMEERGSIQLSDTDARIALRSPQTSDVTKRHIIRNRAVMRAINERKFGDARDEIKGITDLRQKQELRASAIALSTIWRMEGNFKKAYELIEPDYMASSKILFSAFDKHRINVRDLSHHFVCVLRGTVARVVSGEQYPVEDLDHDLLGMEWILDRLRFLPAENHYFTPLPPGKYLCDRLLSIRRRSLASKLADFEVSRIRELTSALGRRGRSV